MHVPQTLMSGAVWTSSSNGMLNLLIMAYLWSFDPDESVEVRARRAFEQFDGLIEGDDGICSAFNVNQSLINHMGVDLKLSVKPNYGQASFCGINCPVGTRDVLYDPIKFLRNFFLLPISYEKARQSLQDAYIRAKSMSYLHDFRSSPIIAPICYRICQLTSGINLDPVLNQMDSYKRDRLTKALKDGPKTWLKEKPLISNHVREHFARLYNVSVDEQIKIENSFNASPTVIGCDLSAWMMPTDDEHSLMHVSDWDLKHVPRWKPYYMPRVLDQLLAERIMGTPLHKANQKIFSEKWCV
jgi:hypothetical protein